MDGLISQPKNIVNIGNDYNTSSFANLDNIMGTQVNGNGNLLGTQGTVMGVGGGVQNAAADVTYSTNPDSQKLGFVNGKYDLTTIEYGRGDNVISTGINNNTHIMGVGGAGNSAVDVTYSTKPSPGVVDLGITTGALATTTQTTYQTAQNGSTIMGAGGVADSAVDVTYSTKPSPGVVDLGITTGALATTTKTTTQYRTDTNGSTVMGVGGVADSAVDVTYSTKPSPETVYLGIGAGAFSITNTIIT